MLLLAAHAAATSTTLGPFTTEVYVALMAALLLWVVVYMLYRLIMTKRKDFGVPVRRRILCRHLKVDADQSAEAPFWWTDLQIQVAVGHHWRDALRAPSTSGNDPQPLV
jgi:hypothetical protein